MAWEFDFLYALQQIRSPILDKVMALLSTLGDMGILWIAIGVLLLFSKKYRCGGWQMLIAMLLTFVVGNLILKNTEFAFVTPVLTEKEFKCKMESIGGAINYIRVKN